ncbi:proline iminopeptidase [Pseudovirgaria hyperparasitica]|uniref:Proline iminopeptidase n=1 Tax=Pseudovirgaria hyperparasitica TaxID=470096 RepID=A0A6A6WKQ2_9PEZI|nr:proline iminopeptidase [Pseudovirgaria hyperparasitica]KAF2762775.1 proline iminopeptidase [Pseudovirgaria hyperparasitica]
MSIPSTEGEAIYDVPGTGKTCKTWFKVYGDLKSNVRPCVLLHGGPGMAHNYLLSMIDLTTIYGIPVVFYDQLGCGRSTLLPEKRGDTSFWTPELFLNELENLIKHLGITTYDVFGNSWGGMLGGQYALRRPLGLTRLIVANSPTDMHTWITETNKLRNELPAEVQEIIAKHEADGTTDSEEYEAAIFVFYKRHVCRVDPMPIPVLDTFDVLKQDDTVYTTMNGPSEFCVVGGLKDWVITPHVHDISVPTMLINGAYDEATDEVVTPWFKELKHVKWVSFAKSSHMPHWEERERFMRVVSGFLKG